jgi:sphingomyelin phosphodiesterase 2
MGDFNSIPTTLPMTVILEHADLQDSWALTHPNTDSSLVSTPLEAVHQLGLTADSPLNTYSAGKAYAQGSWGKRLDYVLYRQPNRLGQLVPQLKAVDSKVVLTDPVPGRNFSYSDHFGLEVTLEIIPSETAQVPTTAKELSSAASATVISALTACYRFSRVRSRKELIISGLCILALIAVVIGTAWLPHSWINPIFILFTIFMAWLATTMFYEGFIFGNWECNALMNVIEELEIHRKGQELLYGRSRE